MSISVLYMNHFREIIKHTKCPLTGFYYHIESNAIQSKYKLRNLKAASERNLKSCSGL